MTDCQHRQLWADGKSSDTAWCPECRSSISLGRPRSRKPGRFRALLGALARRVRIGGAGEVDRCERFDQLDITREQEPPHSIRKQFESNLNDRSPK